MSEAPERIFARFASTGPGINIRKWSTAEFSEAESVYLLADTAIPKAEAEAMLAAILHKAAAMVCSATEKPDSPFDEWGSMRADTFERHAEAEVLWDNWLSREDILSLTPADARAALDKIVREAVDAETERCIGIAKRFSAGGDLKPKFTRADGSQVQRMSANDAIKHGEFIAECIEAAIRETKETGE